MIPRKIHGKSFLRKVPVVDYTDSESPYLLARFLGKLHVITKGISDNVIVLQADTSEGAITSSSSSSTSDPSTSIYDSEVDRKSIASRHFGFIELVSCQVFQI